MQPRILSLFLALLPLLASAQIQLVADVSPGPKSADPSRYQALDGKLYFSATTPATGEELYVYDPVTEQTSLVADLLEGAEGSAPSDLVVLDGKLYFLASKEFFPYFIGRQLYRVLYEYNPAIQQTQLVDDFTYDSDRGVVRSSFPSNLLVLNEKLYILNTDAFIEARAVDIYDPVADSLSSGFFFSDYFGGVPQQGIVLTALDGKVYVGSGSTIIAYDPATQDVSSASVSYNVRELTPFNGKLYYQASASPSGNSTNAELYVFDPATQTETLVSDIYSGQTSSSPQYLTVLDDKLYFQATKFRTGTELYVFNPATNTVDLAADIALGNSSSTPRSLFVFEDLLYFSAQTTALGRELYRYDPSMNTASLVADLAPDTLSSNPGSFSNFQDELYFSATAPATGREVWKLGELPAFTLTLIDAEQDQAITTLNTGSSVDLAALNLVGYNIQANVGNTVARVDFQLTGPLTVNTSDTDAPYSLFGDEQGDFNTQQVQAGDYALTVTPFVQENGSEIAGEPITITFSLVANDLVVLNPRLVRVPGGEAIDSLQDGDEIYLAELPEEFSVVTDATGGSVLFTLTGAETISTVQNTAPLALFGKENEQLIGGSLTPGDYTLTLTPYSQSDQQGYIGEPLVVNFTVNGNPYKEIVISPNVDDREDINSVSPVVIEGSTVIVSANATRISDPEEKFSNLFVYSLNIDSMSLTQTDFEVTSGTYFFYSPPAPTIAINKNLVVFGYSNDEARSQLGIYQLQPDKSLNVTQEIPKASTSNLVVATDGQRIVAGGSNEAEFLPEGGRPFQSVSIYQRMNGQWQVVDSISTPGITDLAIEGNTILLGTSSKEDSSEPGQVLVYSFANGDWTLRQTITPEDTQPGDLFGTAIALQGDQAVIGASGSEAAYVFALQNGQWVQTAQLTASDAQGNDNFGASVALDSARVVVGAPDDNIDGQDGKGSAYAFKLTNGMWTQTAKLTTEQTGVLSYGTTVDISNRNVGIGAKGSKGFVYELIDTLITVPTPRIPSIANVTLINTDNDEDQVIVEAIEDGQEISLQPGDVYEYTLVANVATAGQRIRRVVLDLEAPAGQSRLRTEYAEPYALFGDVRGNVRGQKPYAGQYKLVATPYYLDSQGQEVAGESKTINFTLTTGGLEASNLRVVSVRDGSLVESLEDGDVLALSPEQAVTILADVLYPQFNSLQFDLQGPLSLKRTENFIPYAIFGDVKGALAGKVLPAGQYNLSVIPFLGKNRDAYAGPEVKVSFTVVAQGSNNSEALAYPVPFESELNLRTGSLDLSQARIELVHGYGKVYSVAASQVSQSPEGLRLQLRSDLPAGPYTLRIISQGQLQTFRVSKQ